jgi:hypothetical protein
MNRRRDLATTLVFTILLASGVRCTPETPSVCLGSGASPVPSAAMVCARLQSINCPITECEEAYEQWRRSLDPNTFSRVTHCYHLASNCSEVTACNRVCGPSGGPVEVPMSDASVQDAAMVPDASLDETGG